MQWWTLENIKLWYSELSIKSEYSDVSELFKRIFHLYRISHPHNVSRSLCLLLNRARRISRPLIPSRLLLIAVVEHLLPTLSVGKVHSDGSGTAYDIDAGRSKPASRVSLRVEWNRMDKRLVALEHPTKLLLCGDRGNTTWKSSINGWTRFKTTSRLIPACKSDIN